MKQKLFLKNFFLFFLIASTGYSQIVSTLPFYESFDYTSGTKLFADNASQGLGNWWTDSPRTGTKQEIVAQPTWSLTSNVVAAQNNALSTSTFGEDPEINFTAQSGNFGEVFASMFVQIDASLNSNLDGVSLDRIFQLGSAASVIARGVVDGGGNVIGVQFGVNEDSGAANAADVVWDPTTYNEGEQLFLVFSYTRNSSTDTAAKLWINPVVDGTEPAVTVEDTTIRLTTVDYLRLNIAGSDKTPELIIDEIRIGNSWNDVAPVAPVTNGTVDTTITSTTTPTFPVYESFDNYANGILVPNNTETGIGTWATKDPLATHDFTVVDSPTWGTIGTDTGVNNSGKAIQFSGAGEDAYLQFTEQTGDFGTIYSSFLMKVTDISSLGTTARRLVGFGAINGSGTVSGATHLYVAKDVTDSSKYNIGVNEDNGFSDVPEFVGGAATPTEYSENDELLVVLYFDDTNTGTTAKLWINPTLGAVEPSPDASDSSRDLNASFLIFTQSGSTNTPGVTFDEIRIAHTWGEVTNVKHIWTGASADWATDTNWDNTKVPTTLSNVIIPSGATTEPVIGATTGAVAHNLTVDAAADLSITSGGSLQLTGKAEGDLTYNLSIPDSNWHLVSSPVIDEQYNNAWVTANSIANGTGNNRGISRYDNTTNDPTTGYWRYMQLGDEDTFQTQGYSLKRTATGLYSFTGTYPRFNFEIPISQSGGNNWNLVNNPYPSYMSVADFVTVNTTNLGGAFQAVYVWDPSAGVSGEYSQLTSGYIHPGQAFFVNSAVASGNLDIKESLQTAQTGVTFYKNDSNSSIELILSKNEHKVSTNFNLLENATNGLNPGQDFGMFTGVKSDFTIYSHLVEQNTGIPLKIQSLNKTTLENLEIPIGVEAPEGSEIKFIAKNFDLPKDIDIILEDRITNTFINLNNENSEYTLQLTESSKGTGRFYLHTKSSTLNTTTIGLDDVSIYVSGSSTLNIVGLPQGDLNLKIFNILGERLVNHNLEAISGKSQFNLSNLTSGVYIVKIETEEGNTNKKIILE